ncbi:MAG: hypothetical protein IPN75_09315 [Dechloromonas sp.]|uniref:Uncharacterized protein n=1 Tax=Candidatus Dechloromonas phosphorivorans TaxID=2899244 RepID=A0A9D7QHR3_9RHOO|nr:hypothetical protein [Candidatus Dechloromonas phosphorivorans]
MRDTYPLLVNTDFPAIQRRKLETLQANLGYRVISPAPIAMWRQARREPRK